MALNYDNISATTTEFHIPRLKDQIYDNSPVFTWLRNNDQVKHNGGTLIKQPLEYAKNTARGSYEGYDVMDVTPPEFLTAAIFYWKNYYTTVTYSGDEEDENSGDHAVLNLIDTKMKSATKSLKDLLYTAIFNDGNDAKGIVGLRSAIDTTNTYGGISGNDYSWWRATKDTSAHTQANLVDSTNASYIHKLLRTAWAACHNDNNKPDLIITTQAVFDLYEQTLQPQARYNFSGTGTKFMADAGFQTLEFRGVPIVVDDFCPDYHLFMGNFGDSLDLYIHPKKDFKWTGLVRPANQDAMTGQILFKGQLAVNTRRNFYKFTSLGAS